MNTLPKIFPMKDYYRTEGVQKTCHDIKQNEDKELRQKAIKEIGDYFISLDVLDKNAVLIPAPQHTGKAEYTLELCEYLASKTGATIWDNLARIPDKTLYDKRKENTDSIPTLLISRKEIEKKLPTGTYFFIDNVMTTGVTFITSYSLLGVKLYPLVYAIDFDAVNEYVFHKVCSLWEQFKKGGNHYIKSGRT